MLLLWILFIIFSSCCSSLLPERELHTLEEARVDGIVEVDNKVYILTNEDFNSWCDEPTSSYITELTLEGDVLRKSKIGEDGDISQALHVGPKPGTLLAMPGGPTQCHEHRSRCVKEISISTLQTLWKDERITTSNNVCPPIGLLDGSVITATNRTIFKTGGDGSDAWNVTAELMEACVSISPDEDRIYYVDRGEAGDPIKVLSTEDGSLVDYLSDVNDPSEKCSGGKVLLSSDGRHIYQYRRNDGKNGRLAVVDAKNLNSPSGHNVHLKINDAQWSTAILNADNNCFLFVADTRHGGSTQCLNLCSNPPGRQWTYYSPFDNASPSTMIQDGSQLLMVEDHRILVLDAWTRDVLMASPPTNSATTTEYLNRDGHRLYIATKTSSQDSTVHVFEPRGTLNHFKSQTHTQSKPGTLPSQSQSKSADSSELAHGDEQHGRYGNDESDHHQAPSVQASNDSDLIRILGALCFCSLVAAWRVFTGTIAAPSRRRGLRQHGLEGRAPPRPPIARNATRTTSTFQTSYQFTSTSTANSVPPSSSIPNYGTTESAQ